MNEWPHCGPNSVPGTKFQGNGVAEARPHLGGVDEAYRHQSPLYWHDTDWLAAALAMVAVLIYAVVRAVYGDKPAPHSAKHIRFGPNATATDAAPEPGQPRP